MKAYAIDFEKVCAVEYCEKEHIESKAKVHFDSGVTLEIEVDKEGFDALVEAWGACMNNDLAEFLEELLEEL